MKDIGKAKDLFNGSADCERKHGKGVGATRDRLTLPN